MYQAKKMQETNYLKHFLIGNNLIEQKKHQDAKKYLLKSHQLKPDYISNLVFLARAYHNNFNKTDSSIYFYSKALQLDSNNVTVLNDLGIIYLNSNDAH